MVRVLVGAVVGAIVMFMWGFVSHMLLPIGEMGISSMSGEEPVLRAMQASISEPGLYYFPGDPGHDMAEEWVARHQAGPRGILVYHPEGSDPLSPAQLGTQFGTDLLLCLVAAVMLTMVAASYGGRVLFLVLLGVIAWLGVSVPHWNWYGFPADFTAAQLIDGVGGWLVTGIVLAAIVTGRKPGPGRAFDPS